MPARVGALVLALAVTLQGGSVQGQIRVVSPPALVEQFAFTGAKIEGSVATFGAPFYGERLMGQLVWTPSLQGHAHCSDEDYEMPPPIGGRLQFLLVRRGVCSFVDKVRTAQRKGADAVIIADSLESELGSGDIRRVIIADADDAADIDVPSILISREDGNILIDAAELGEVVVELAWDVPKGESVLVDLWMSSASPQSMRFLSDFAPRRTELSTSVKFVPHYHVFGMDPGNASENYCTDASARFCTNDPDGTGRLTGAAVIEEDLRQLCIRDVEKASGAKDDSSIAGGVAEKYWHYVERMAETCPLNGTVEGERFGKRCSVGLMYALGINVAAVETCTQTQREEKLMEQRSDVAWGPRALRINGWRYSGATNGANVAKAICAAFETQPAACRRLAAARRRGQRGSAALNAEAATAAAPAVPSPPLVFWPAQARSPLAGAPHPQPPRVVVALALASLFAGGLFFWHSRETKLVALIEQDEVALQEHSQLYMRLH